MMRNYLDYALSFLGRPYIWGGDGSGKTHGGFDCSGLVLEALKACGIIPSGQDLTAKGLFERLSSLGWIKVPVELMSAQDIVFWGKSTGSITHVAIALDKSHILEAGGGGSKCTSPEKSTGMVRVRPLDVRESPVAILRAP